MSLDLYLNFKGNCREAVEFYADTFGVEKQKILTYGDTPPNPEFPISEETKKLVMHTFLNIMGRMVMFSDITEGMPFILGNNISIIVNSKDIEEIKLLFNKLKVGGTISVDLQETFWTKCYGFVVDKYGIGWQFSHESGDPQM